MFIASRKKKENIAEYLLYMWQIEDIIRANHLKIESIEENVINKFDYSEEEKRQMYEWYESLIEMMRLESKQFQGHIQLLENVIIDLTDLHLQLLQSHKVPEYKMAYYKVLPFIIELRNKNKNTEECEIETCFSALYGYLLLKLQQKEVSEETEKAVREISSFLSLLARYYKMDKEGELEIEE